MAVPAHDERDFAFAKKYELPIIASIYPIIRGNYSLDELNEELNEELNSQIKKIDNTEICFTEK